MLHRNQTTDPLHSLFSHGSTSYIVTNTQRCKYLASEADIWFMKEYEQWALCRVAECNAMLQFRKKRFHSNLHCSVGTFNITHLLYSMKNNKKNIKSSLHFIFIPKVFIVSAFVSVKLISGQNLFSKLSLLITKLFIKYHYP